MGESSEANLLAGQTKKVRLASLAAARGMIFFAHAWLPLGIMEDSALALQFGHPALVSLRQNES